MSHASPQQWNNRLMAVQAEIADPDRPPELKLGSYITLGRRYYDEAKNYALALQQFESALQLNPNSIEALAGQGDAFRHLRRETEAIVTYGLAIARSPRRAELWMNRGRCYEHLEQWAEAATDYEASLDLDPSNYRLWQRHANLLYRQERYGGALISYAQAIAAQPLEAEEITSQCLFLASPGPYVQRYRKSFEAIDKKLAKLQNLAQLQEAERQASAPHGVPHKQAGANALDPLKAAKLWQLQGERLANYGFWMEAIASFDQALLLRPHRADLHQKRAAALHALGRLVEAATGYRQALALYVTQENLVGETECREAMAQLQQEQSQPVHQPRYSTLWGQLQQQIKSRVGWN